MFKQVLVKRWPTLAMILALMSIHVLVPTQAQHVSYSYQVTISNSRLTTTGPNFPQLIVVNDSFVTGINAVGSNLWFSTEPLGGTSLPSWICSLTSGSNSRQIQIWVQIPQDIGAQSNVSVYLNVNSSATTNGFSANGPAGEAPWLSSIYNEYDNGNLIFDDQYNITCHSLSGCTGVPLHVAQFDGYSIANSSSLKSTIFRPPFTLSLWVNPTVLGRDIIGDYSCYTGFALFTDSEGGITLASSLVGKWSTGVTITAGQFWFLTVAFTETSQALYVNGELKGSWNYGYETTEGTDPLSACYYFGIGYASWGAFHQGIFIGSIANVQVYNTLLTATQINTLYNAGIGAVPLNSTNISAWWLLNGDALDNSLNGHDLTDQSILYPYFLSPSAPDNIMPTATIPRLKDCSFSNDTCGSSSSCIIVSADRLNTCNCRSDNSSVARSDIYSATTICSSNASVTLGERSLDDVKSSCSFQSAVSTCQQAYDSGLLTSSGTFNLTFNNTVMPTYCEIINGIAYALIMKIDGNSQTFSYDSSYWTSMIGYNDAGYSTGLDNTEYQSPLYWQYPFAELLLGMRTSGSDTINWIVMDYNGTSLWDVIHNGDYVNVTSVSVEQWRSLVGAGASLQSNCNKAGFNVFADPGYGGWFQALNEVRIGILTNQENDCLSPDSRIGFGASYECGCDIDFSGSCGNKCCVLAVCDNGEGAGMKFGYILASSSATKIAYFPIRKTTLTTISPTVSTKVLPVTSVTSQPAISTCQQAYDSGLLTSSGTIDLTINKTIVSTYCEIINGIAYALIMKIDGNNQTFSYDSSYWTSQIGYNDAGYSTGLDNTEYQSPLYWQYPFSRLLLGMRTSGSDAINWIVMDYNGSSLWDVIHNGDYVNVTSVTAEQWRSLVGAQASLQPNCHKAGFNVFADPGFAPSLWTQIRIGILANQENDCWSPDSRIGFGGSGAVACFNEYAGSCGNKCCAWAGCDNGWGPGTTFGYILAMSRVSTAASAPSSPSSPSSPTSAVVPVVVGSVALFTIFCGLHRRKRKLTPHVIPINRSNQVIPLILGASNTAFTPSVVSPSVEVTTYGHSQDVPPPSCNIAVPGPRTNVVFVRPVSGLPDATPALKPVRLPSITAGRTQLLPLMT